MTLSLLPPCIALLCLQLVSGTIIQSHGCSEGQSTCLTPGEEYVIHCFVDNTGASLNLLTWTVPGHPTNSLSVLFNENNGVSGGPGGGFTARRVSSGANTINSSLTFTANMSLDEEIVRCRDNTGTQATDSCTLLVDTNPDIVTELSVTNVTYHSVSLSWSPLMDTGGCLFNYIITVIPLNGNSSWEVSTIENVTTYNITGLTFGESYNFTVSGNNTAGEGDPSDTVNTVLPGQVPPPINEVEVCMNYSTLQEVTLAIDWKPCPIVITDPFQTPPVINYTINIVPMDGGGGSMNTSCGAYSRSVSEGQSYTIGITVNNIVGSSSMTSTTFDATWLRLREGSSNGTIIYSTVQCIVLNTSHWFINVTYTNETLPTPTSTIISYVANTTDSVIVPGNTVSYTLQVYNSNGRVGSSIVGPIIFSTMATSSVMPTTTATTTDTNTMVTVTPSIASSSTPPTNSPGTSGLSTTAYIGIGVGVAVIIVVVVILIVVGYLIYRKPWKGERAKFNQSKRDSTEPIALVNKEPAPETGQALYQEPDTIKREAAPTGDLYAQPDKPRRNAPSKPEESSKELPTYQDPNTIQRTQAPAMDYLYAEVDKKKEQQMYAQVDKDKKGGDGTVYADLALSNTGGQGGYPGTSNPVIYSDVNTK